MAKPFTVQHVAVLSLTAFLAGIALLAVGILDLIGIRFEEMGGWGFWFIGIGFILVLIGGIWYASYRLNVRKFHKLMEEQSKANFVKKQDDVEYLAWRLPMKFEDELLVKKKGFGLK